MHSSGWRASKRTTRTTTRPLHPSRHGKSAEHQSLFTEDVRPLLTDQPLPSDDYHRGLTTLHTTKVADAVRCYKPSVLLGGYPPPVDDVERTLPRSIHGAHSRSYAADTARRSTATRTSSTRPPSTHVPSAAAAPTMPPTCSTAPRAQPNYIWLICGSGRWRSPGTCAYRSRATTAQTRARPNLAAGYNNNNNKGLACHSLYECTVRLPPILTKPAVQSAVRSPHVSSVPAGVPW